jgi:hypothetical protein
MKTATLTPTRFDSPQFPLVLASGPADIANVSNALEIGYRGREMVKYLNVHTGLFQIMLALNVPLDSSVTLYLDEDGRKMVFGILIDDNRLIDLWHYTTDQLPPALFV